MTKCWWSDYGYLCKSLSSPQLPLFHSPCKSIPPCKELVLSSSILGANAWLRSISKAMCFSYTGIGGMCKRKWIWERGTSRPRISLICDLLSTQKGLITGHSHHKCKSVPQWTLPAPPALLIGRGVLFFFFLSFEQAKSLLWNLLCNSKKTNKLHTH